jgi:translocation and assembly module TamA
MKEGAGAGIRWNAPFGQVRLDLARAIDDGGNSWRVHLTLGADL